MYPEERTGTSALRTRWHPRGYRKISEPVPYTGLINTENCEILWLNSLCIVLVRNSQSAPPHILETTRMELRDWRAWAGIVRVVRVTDVAAIS